jgi:hypothetical protein
MLDPMEEVVEFSPVRNHLFEVGDGLFPQETDLASEPEAGCWQIHGERQGGLTIANAELEFVPT